MNKFIDSYVSLIMTRKSENKIRGQPLDIDPAPNVSTQGIHLENLVALKEYYEIVGESRPLSAFFPTHADLFTEMHFYS